MPAKKFPPVKKSARPKKLTAKKQVSACDEVKITIDLGPLEATPEQISRLKAYLENQVLTWVKSDLENNTVPPIKADEFRQPPPSPAASPDGK
jgi:hypothetical protein